MLNYSILFNPLFIIICLLVLQFFIFFTVASQQENRKKSQLQEALLFQQQDYLHILEKNQKEMRTFQHNYKNTLSALYLQAKSGDTIGIQNYLDETIIGFNHALAHQIKKTSDLTNIKMPELKSLLLTKLMIMEQSKIDFNLEVINPIAEVSMSISDLVHCLGILLDNAIEATDNGETIKLVLSNEQNDLIVIITNPLKIKPILSEIWKNGYSTKGKNRGLGLANYQDILNKYPTVYKETIATDSEFKQVLKIKK